MTMFNIPRDYNCPPSTSSLPKESIRECALRHRLPEEQIDRIANAMKLVGLDMDGPMGDRFNAQHLISCKLGFSPEDVLSDWFTYTHRCAAEDGASIDLRGATEPEAFGLSHGLSKAEVAGLPEKQIYAAADRKDCQKLIAYAINYGISPEIFRNITTKREFHSLIDNNNIPGLSYTVSREGQRVKLISAGFHPPFFNSRAYWFLSKTQILSLTYDL